MIDSTDSWDRIAQLVKQIPDARTKAERTVIAKGLLDHFTYLQGEYNHAIDTNLGDDEYFDITGEEHF